MFVSLYLFVSGLMSYLRYLCIFEYGGIQRILHCNFVLFVFILCIQYFQFLWIVQRLFTSNTTIITIFLCNVL
jgi:hypothetical protein